MRRVILSVCGVREQIGLVRVNTHTHHICSMELSSDPLSSLFPPLWGSLSTAFKMAGTEGRRKRAFFKQMVANPREGEGIAADCVTEPWLCTRGRTRQDHTQYINHDRVITVQLA